MCSSSKLAFPHTLHTILIVAPLPILALYIVLFFAFLFYQSVIMGTQNAEKPPGRIIPTERLRHIYSIISTLYPSHFTM